MPVKNTKRRTNDGLEGVITGLTEEEKKVLEDAGIGGGTAVEANPQEEATQQLEKIKIDNIAYNIASGEGVVKLYRHSISLLKTNILIYFDIYSTIPNAFTFPELYETIEKDVTCTGFIKVADIQGQPVQIHYVPKSKEYGISYIDTNGQSHATSTSNSSVSMLDYVAPVK